MNLVQLTVKNTTQDPHTHQAKSRRLQAATSTSATNLNRVVEHPSTSSPASISASFEDPIGLAVFLSIHGRRGGGVPSGSTDRRAGVRVGIRVTRNFRVGFFGFLKFRVLRIVTRNLSEIIKTRHFGYPKIRVRVYPNCPISTCQTTSEQ